MTIGHPIDFSLQYAMLYCFLFHFVKVKKKKKNKAVCTATEVAYRWARAVIKNTEQSIWAGATVQKPPINAKKLTMTDGPMDRPTNQHSGL